MKAKLAVLTTCLVGLIVVSLIFVFKSSAVPSQMTWAQTDAASNIAQAYVLPIAETSYIPILDASVPVPTVSAKAALVYDVESSRLLFEKNSQSHVPIASLTKVLTALVAADIFHASDVVTVGKESVKVDDARQDLYAGEHITVGDLIKLMLAASSNDAAYALAAYAKEQGVDFVAAMNEKSRRLEMTDSQFLDPAGLNDQARSTARDLVKLVRATLNQDWLWSPTREKELTLVSQDGMTHAVKNTDQLLGIIPDIIGGKTGNTDEALGCMILLVKIPGKDDTIVSIVLGSKTRFDDTKALVDWVRRAYRWE